MRPNVNLMKALLIRALQIYHQDISGLIQAGVTCSAGKHPLFI